MSQILISYGTTYGQTAKIVRRMSRVLENHGHTVSAYRADLIQPDLPVGSYDACVVAGSVIGGKHQRSVLEFVRRYADQLNAITSAFVSVSGSAANAPEKARRCADSFLAQTSWRPAF